MFVLLKVIDIGFKEGVIPGEIGTVDRPTMRGLEEKARIGAIVGGGQQGIFIPRNDGVEIAISIHGDDVPPTFGRFYLDLRERLRVRYWEVASLDQREDAVVDAS